MSKMINTAIIAERAIKEWKESPAIRAKYPSVIDYALFLEAKEAWDNDPQIREEFRLGGLDSYVAFQRNRDSVRYAPKVAVGKED
jgi:hypothetical protein